MSAVQVWVQRADQRPGRSARDILARSVVRDGRRSDPLRESLVHVVTLFGGSTGGYANGRIPTVVLCPLEFAPGHLLRCDAAERLTALSGAFEREFGYPIPITDSYRSYVQQVAVASAKPHLAAIPGTSNHGWGLAVDLSDPIAGGASSEYAWLRVHGPDYGWDNPSWARPEGFKPEPWHFEFFAAGPVPDRATDPSAVGAWGATDAPDLGARHEAAAGGSRPNDRPADVRPPAEDAVDRPGAEHPAQKPPKPATPTPKPTPSDPAPKPSATPTGPAPTRTPEPAPTPEPSQEPSAVPEPSPSPAQPSQEPPAQPSPVSPAPTPSPTPAQGGHEGPEVSAGVSASSGPLSGLIRGLGLAGENAGG
jgi:hypothetical protein